MAVFSVCLGMNVKNNPLTYSLYENGDSDGYAPIVGELGITTEDGDYITTEGGVLITTE